MLWTITPTFDNLPWRVDLYSGSRLFGSVVRVLDFYWADRVRIPQKTFISPDQ